MNSAGAHAEWCSNLTCLMKCPQALAVNFQSASDTLSYLWNLRSSGTLRWNCAMVGVKGLSTILTI